MQAIEIIGPETYVAMPWKNGGGITREILKREEAGTLIWRLSIAEVASDGPFSSFAGLSRILTVIEGEGLELQTPDEMIVAEALNPVAFSGDTPIYCMRRSTLVTDFNVIFCSSRVAAEVKVLAGPAPVTLQCDITTIHAALLLAGGQVDLETVAPLSLVLLSRGQAILDCDGPVIHVKMRSL